jgi:hypothetical protein
MEQKIQPLNRVIVESTVHSVISAVVGDTLGRTLNHYDYAERSFVVGEWIRNSRGEYPVHRLDESKTGKPSFNTKVMYTVLGLLSDYSPFTDSSVEEFGAHYAELMDDRLQERYEHSILVGSALALGYHSGLATLREGVSYRLLERAIDLVYEPISKVAGWQGEKLVCITHTSPYHAQAGSRRLLRQACG